MEELTKQQIILVTLLVSFVTSIATGIVTVALMDQAPPAVTQTINRVVERTIEKVVPTQNQTAAVVTKETVVVKESDLIVSAVEKNSKSLVSVVAVRGEGEARKRVFLGNGLIVDKDGRIITEASVAVPALDENNGLIPQSFEAVFSDGSVLSLTVLPSPNGTEFILFKPTVDSKTRNTAFSPANLSPSSPKLGQTVIALGGEKLSVATGIVSGFGSESAPAESKSATSTDSGAFGSIIKTDIRGIGRAPGSILLTLSGEVVGIRLGPALETEGAFLPATVLKNLLGM